MTFFLSKTSLRLLNKLTRKNPVRPTEQGFVFIGKGQK